MAELAQILQKKYAISADKETVKAMLEVHKIAFNSSVHKLEQELLTIKQTLNKVMAQLAQNFRRPAYISYIFTLCIAYPGILLVYAF